MVQGETHSMVMTCFDNPAESFTHDHDGNLTVDATLDYAWDAGTLDISGLATRAVADACPPEKSRENRLIGVTPKSPSYGDYKYAYEYDYMGRVVAWYIYMHDGTNWPGTPDWTLYRVYDGWNLLMEWLSGSTPTKWTWGLDLSGSIHGAGGVGGLLAMNTSGSNGKWYFYDGNPLTRDATSSLLDAQRPSRVKGNTILETGLDTTASPFRFSTKYRQWPPCSNAGEMYYYGYRWYSAPTGRWMSRDPIEERGGLNLYGFVGNGPIGQFDRLGLMPLILIGGTSKSASHCLSVSASAGAVSFT